MNIMEMKNERMKLVKGMREMMDRYENAEMPAEDRAAFDKMEKDFDSLNERIEAAERLQERERRLGEQDPAPRAQHGDRIQLFARALSGDAAAVTAYRNSYTLDVGATAGYLTAPMEFREELIKGLNDSTSMRAIGHITPTIGAAQSLGYPYRKTEAADADWLAETATAPEESTLEYGQREFKPHRMAKLIKLSQTLMRHAPMASDTLREELRYRIAITQEKAYMTGDGSGKPLGVFTASESGITTARDIETAAAGKLTMDDIFETKYALKGQYHARASWVMHRDLVKTIAKLKDNNGQYIWQPSTQMGQPDRLLNSPVYMSEYAPNDYSGGKYAAVYGDFGYYWICDADPIEIKVLNELYAPTNQIGYLIQYFGDGAPVVNEAFARIKFKVG